MKTKRLLLLCLMVVTVSLQAQEYEANWASLDQRPVPAWFEDAKFGIFIHWGPYSVPAWSPKGTYTEWYQYWLQSKKLFGNGDFEGDEVYRYHVKTYGEDFPYYNFGEMFTADLFDPKEWAALFEEAGAKYIVLTSKHHDGFTLWPNEQANDRGFAWNSMEVGAHRDLVGELTKAVRKTEVKMGVYYSLYEWYHPWWQHDKERFVEDHYLPQIKDLVQRYQPDILWTDGEWEMEGEQWKSEAFLAWLYNESAAKDHILVNDRWGKGLRQQHGGYYTTEYEAGKTFDKPWEECRGMGFSFGYNQNEDAQDYNSAQALILMLVDIVSNGGNLLLDIGPDARGNIPPIMQERLLEIGQWLEVNGEAIYGTRKWTKAAQWSEGDREIDHEKGYRGGDYILKQTIDPTPGKAVKQLFFTQKEGDVYAISPVYPAETLRIKDLQASTSTEVTLLGHDAPLDFQQQGKDLLVTVPRLASNQMPCQHAWSFRITNVE
ncbi:alpha-L-fucosidase [Echinicola vietnamensis]|uniref:alpha-L-fucosidase n=1 Tax=Echinicola vietnamensis (strain DSM 17526 / LMG 23754 / KMM 6221) TaxID=926556 RepID=L0G5M4_ECHVK|nr:alpha-L-fucosidase [Echinicola vietnamensis]AGA80140.1 alpha-L-fucosidase [Echinicola vietnamensis DSM 17526]